MVAVYTGSGLGLFNTSLTQLGNAGGGRIGQGASSQYVNLSTGNLVLQDLDESLLVRGFGAALLRTYNSRGSVAGQGQDGWVTGYERNLVLSGTLNAAGSTMNLIVGDGQTVAFAWSGTANRYVATGGDGAHDTLTWDGASATWTLVEGSSRREEQFANHADAVLKGRLQRIRDLRSDSGAPAQYDVVYDAQGRVSEVRAVDGAGSGADAIVFGYNGAGQLATIHTRENGVLRSQVSYGYEFADGSGRLTWVQTDLTPHDAGDNTWDAAVPGNNDGRSFRTSYTYVTASAADLRVAGITTGDGVTVAYTYEADGVGGHRIKSVTLGGGVDALPQTTTFVYRTNATDVVDGNGRTWTYEYDADRQLTAVIEPAIDGLRRKTEYRYDGAGNLVRMLQAPFVGATAQLDTTFEYDANGNRTLQRDLLGNTVTWTYNADNQVATESRYTVPAVPEQGKSPTFTPPSGELSRSYVYDNRNRLRFEIDATGTVRELTYATGGNGIGQVASERRYLGAIYAGAFDEASLSAWATNATAMRRANSALTVYDYDAKGRLAQAVTYATVSADANGNGLLDAATSIVNRVHDAQGLLRQTITVHGPGRTLAGAPPAGSEVVDYVYDGMGRLLSVLSRNASTAAMPDARIDPAGHAAWLAANDAGTVLTTYAYADSGRQVWTTHDTGLIRLDQYSRTGQLGIVTEFGPSGVDNRYTYHYYDGNGQLRGSRDASGGMRYFFYDEAGRLTGTVDETGAVVETRYDGAGRPAQTIAYATRVDTSAWLSMTKGMAKHVVKNRLLFSQTSPKPGDEDVWVRIDAANDRSASRSYDGAGRLATETDAAGLVTTYVYDGASRLISTTLAKPGDATVVPRTTRMFHDAEGRLRAVLDAAGYLVETVHDAGGRAVKTIRYARITNAAYWTNGTLDQLRPVADTADQTTRLFYNARSQQIGMLDAEGYLTAFVYDDANHQRGVKNYAKRLTDLIGDESFLALSTAAMIDAPPEPFRLTQRSYNALGQLFLELNHEGTVTRHSYDEAGRLVKTEAAQTTSEIRAGNLRYDLFGNLIGELSGQGSTHLLPGMTEAQIDAVYAQYGVRHSYDLVGRRIESIDAAGNKTWYFHDAAGRETFVIRGVHDSGNLQNAQGEVVETRYNAFGDVVDSIAYTGRITLGIPGSRASAQSAIAALTIGGADSRVQSRYDTRGLLSERIDAEGYRTLYAHTAFGELWTQQDLEANGSVRRTITNTYDIRGLLTGQSENGGTLGRSMGAIHDAFGRVTTRTDARGNTVSIGYDRLGRTISQSANDVSGRNQTVRMAYDAFGRTVDLTDALGRITRYVHSDSARSVTTITPENVRVTTTYNRFGQVFTVSQTLPNGTVATTTTNYDKDGRILDVTDPLGRIDRNEYDTRGLLVATVDGSDRRVEYRYDAAGRVLRTIEDPNGLALTTTTTYDGQGRTLTVVDASGRETRMTYDRNGNLTESLVDPTGLALRTTYVWDRDGRQLTMTEGAGTAAARTVSYGYDRFGRRITETVAPGTLDLVTTYDFDANDNVVRRTDASGRVTRFSYDAANRLRFSVDAAGGVTEIAYDAAGRIKMTRDYATVAVISALSSAPSEAEVAALIVSQSLRDDAKDDARYTVHDRDGRVALTVDGAGGVVAVGYDSAGRAVTERRHAQKVPLSAALRESLRLGTATVADVGASADAKDMFVRQVYDAAGQAAFTVDAAGAIVRMHYDGAGRTVARVRYATALNPAAIGDATSVAQLAAAVTPSTADQIEYFVHDAAGRLRYTLTGAGTLAQTGYDAAGRVSMARQFAVAMTVTAALRGKLLAGTAVESDFSAFVAANADTARAEYRVHDSAGRVRFTVARADAGQGVVAEVRYDASGQVVSSRQYGAMIAFDPGDTESELTVALSAVESRISRFAYDSAGRQRFALDATGALTETRYDGAGRVTDTIAYGQRPPAGTTSFSGLVAWANAQPLDSLRHARTVYDAAGRLHIDTNALNQSEVHEYDGAGRKVARTDRNGKVWLYEHDAAGNVAAEYSPMVTIATVDANGVVSSAVRSIVTRYAYDANGNMLSRTENADAPIAAERRTTDYEYDSRGHQVRIVFADPGAVDPATGAIALTGSRPTIEVVYDALGQAVVQKDVRGHYSYRVYDALGRLVHEIDQEKQVTSYGHNVYGEQTSVRRHANDLGAIAGWADGQAISLAQMQAGGQPAASMDDRTLLTHYDLRGLKTKVELSSVAYRTANGLGASGTPTTSYGYNAYGDQVTESVLLEGVPGSGTEQWATTYRYHDALGRNTLTVDPLGYVTETEYNATGEATKTVEYARALTQTPDIAVRPGVPAPGDAAIGADRITRWTYDAVGRKASETAVRQYRRPDGSTGSRDVTTLFGYDGEGRTTSLSDDTGTTTTTYDALGRALSVQEPVRDVVVQGMDVVLGASANRDLTTGLLYEQRSPYTTMAYDAFGNAVEVRRYANGRNGTQTAVADDARDQVQRVRHDRQGRAVWMRDGEGAIVTRSFDAADNVTGVRYTLTGNGGRSAVVQVVNSYDRTGRQDSTLTTRDLLLGGSPQGSVVDTGETVTYNAFGEIATKTLHGLSGTLVYSYDAAGRMTGSNESGAPREFGYNLAGHQVYAKQRAYLSTTGGVDTVVDAITLTRVDKLGRTLQVIPPSHTADPATTSTLTQAVDRWGNVLRIVDTRGYRTDYEYNSLDQLVREIRPLVKVVSENGGVEWRRPENQRYYDALGRLVATRDANGNLRTTEYDATGRMVASRDAYGNATRFAYDALGNQRATQNPLGYLAFKEYDRMGRVVAIGDYLPGANGATRDKAYLQRYVLNENGDRLRVANLYDWGSRYDYDSRNQLIRSETQLGVVMEYAYDAAARKILERNALSIAANAPTWVDREGETVRLDESSWNYDVFGRLIDHNNLSGRDSDYEYNAESGQLRRETGVGGQSIAAPAADRRISYYANGRIRQVIEGTSSYAYEYDAAGNRTLEEVTTTDAYGLQVRTRTRTTYDSNNRVERVTQDDLSSGKRIFDLLTEYDANGNRRHVRALSGYGPNVDAIPVVNNAPVVIRAIDDRTVRKGMTSEFRLLFSDIFRDAEQNALTLAIAEGDGTALPVWLQVAHDPVTGEIVFVANPAANLADQDIVVRLTASEVGNPGNAVNATFTVRVRTNTAPILIESGDIALHVKTGQPWHMDLVAADYFRDADVGDVLTLGIDNALPSWVSIDAATPGVIRLSGTPQGSGSFALRLRAHDQLNASVVKQFNITHAPNAAPGVVATPAPVDAIIGRQFAWSRDLPEVFADPDGDRMRITAALVGGGALPEWLSFQYLYDQATPQIVFAGNVPTDEVDGRTYSIVLTATDVDGASSSTTLAVRVFANRAPAATAGTQTLTLRQNDAFTQTLSLSSLFDDPENDALNLTALWPQGSVLPHWLKMTVDHTAKTVTFSKIPGNTPIVGTFAFSVRATDIAGLAGTKTFSIVVGADNAPVRSGVALPDRALSINRTFTYTLPDGLFSDPDGDAFVLHADLIQQGYDPEPGIPNPYSVEYLPLPSWMSFDAATRTFTGLVPANQSSPIILRITARDSRGLRNIVDETFVGGANVNTDGDIRISFQTWTNTAPTYTAGALQPRSGIEAQPVDFALPANAFIEPDGDALTYSAQVQIGANWVDIATIGLAIDAATGRITGTLANLTQSNYTVRIQARDPQQAPASGTFALSVSRRPVAPASLSHQVMLNQPFSYTVPGFSDPEGGTLTYTARMANGAALPAWLDFSSAGVLGGTGTTLASYAIEITATDPSGLSSSTILQLAVANNPPVYTPGALANQAAQPSQPFNYTVPANAFTDPNGDPLTYSADWNSGPLPSWLSFNPTTRAFSGTPTSAGSWTIRVVASDGASTASATFTISTANLGPVLNTPLPVRIAPVNTAVSWPLPAGAITDPNGDALTYALEVLLPGYMTLRWVPGDNAWEPEWVDPVWVAATVSNVGLSIVANGASGGTISGTLKALQSRGNDIPQGTTPVQTTQTNHDYSLRIVARDPEGASVYGAFQTVANVAPVGPTIGTQTARQNVFYSFVPPAFTDVNNQTLTYSMTGLPAGLSFDAPARTIGGTPTGSGPSIVQYTANDGNGGTTTVSFTLNVQANNAPAAPAVSAQTGTLNVHLSFGLPAFTDADFDTLTYGIAGLPPGLSFDAVSRTISGTPTAAGSWNVTYTANDGRGGTASVVFDFTIGTSVPANRPPVVNVPLSDQTADSGTYFEYIIPADAFRDPDNNPLTYSAIRVGGSMPAWLTFNPATRTFSGTPTGAVTQNFTLRVTATDPGGLFVSDEFVLTKLGDSGGQLIDEAEGETYRFEMGAAQAPEGEKDGADGTGEVSTIEALATSVPVQVKDEWFVYDAENRLKLVGGQLIGAAGAQGTYIGLGVSAAESHELMYDAAGQAIGRLVKAGVNEIVYRTTYDLRGRKQYEFHAEYLNPVNFEFGGIAKMYRYDDLNQLSQTHSYYQNGTRVNAPLDGEGFPIGVAMSVAGWLSGAEVFHYDADGRMTVQVTRSRANGLQGIQWREPGTFDETAERSDINLLAADSWVQYSDAAGVSGYDVLGRVSIYRYAAANMQWAIHTFTSTYERWEGYQEKTVAGTSTNSNYKPTTNTLTYDAFGRLSRQLEHTEYQNNAIDDRVRAYAYTGEGRVQTRREGTIHDGVFTQTPDNTGARNNYQFVHAAGQQQAELREGGQIRNNHHVYNTPQIQTLNGRGNYAAGGGTVVALQGETLQSLAQRVYGNGSLWYVLADANGLSDPNGELVAGTQLNTPRVSVNANDAGTFKPYNPGEAIGSTTPGLPFITPPPKQNCNVLATILIVIIAVVVTVYTAGAAATYFAGGASAVGGAGTGAVGLSALGGGAIAGAAAGTTLGTAAAIGGAAVGGFVGSVASQVVGKALGVVDGFSLRSAVASGLTAGLTAGVGSTGLIGQIAGKAGDFAHIAKGALTSAVGGVTSHAANRVAGIDVGFSWRSIAANAVTGAITAGLTSKFDMEYSGWRAFRNDVLHGAISGVVGLHARRAFGFDDRVDYGAILADAFGNASANALVAHLSPVREQPVEPEPEPLPDYLMADGADGLAAEGGYGDFFDAYSLLDRILEGGIDGGMTQDGSASRAVGDVVAPNGSSAAGGGLEKTIQNIAFASHRGHTESFGAAYSNHIDAPDPNWTDAQTWDWVRQFHTVHATLPAHSDHVIEPNQRPAEVVPDVAASTNYRVLGLDEDPHAGADAWDAASYAARYTLYEVWNFASLGFVKRHDARLIDEANGRLSSGDFWTATTIDAISSVGSLYLGGRAGNYVLGRFGTGYAGNLLSGGTVGGITNLGQQWGGMATYALSDGRTGQSSFSWNALAWSAGGGAAFGGAMRYAQTASWLQMPLKFQSPVVLQRGTVLTSGGLPAIESIRSPIVRMSPGEALRAKYAGLSPAERTARMRSLAEANAHRRLSELENSITGAHFLEKHGAQTTLASQLQRVQTGRNPTTGVVELKKNGQPILPPAATRFLSHRDQLTAIKRAELILRRNPNNPTWAERPISFGRAIGEGHQKTTLSYGRQYSATVWFRNGQVNTAFPQWGM